MPPVVLPMTSLSVWRHLSGRAAAVAGGVPTCSAGQSVCRTGQQDLMDGDDGADSTEQTV